MPDQYGHNTSEEIAQQHRIEAILTPDSVIREMSDPCTCGMHKLGEHFPVHGHAHNCPVFLEWHRQHSAACDAVVGGNDAK